MMSVFWAELARSEMPVRALVAPTPWHSTAALNLELFL